MGDECPMTVPAGGFVSISAGGYACWTAVGAVIVSVGEGAIKLGRVGAPPHEVMIKLINRRQFTVRVMRIFVINPQELMKSSTNFIIHLMVVENQKRTRSRVLF